MLIRLRAGKPLPNTDEGSLKDHAMAIDAQTLYVSEQVNPQVATFLRTYAATSNANGFASNLTRHNDAPVRMAFNISVIAKQVPVNLPPEARLFAPLWEDVTVASMGLNLGNEMSAEVLLDSKNPQTVSDTLMAAKTLARNAMRGFASGAQGENMPPQQVMLFGMMHQLANKALDEVQIKATEKQVMVNLKMDQSAPIMVGIALPAIQAARESSRRMVAMNNLKQIGLALHNYHDAYGHFPPAVIEQNGVKRSWRVEILPFIEQIALYEQYKKDEPWDSPANKRVLESLVPVYAALESGNPDKTLTPFRGISGAHGALKAGKGIKLQNVTDGTSMTIGVVETSAMVPGPNPTNSNPILKI